ncbi:MAG: alcohol dehydrogenase catalytic domain-containing protein [Planctomycetota bacterium]|jgi:propanol-preferring alcohol dehydrogenase
MKAWVLDGPGAVTSEGPLALRDVPDPVPDEGEIVVAVSACGLCRTDLHIVQGEIPLPQLPIVPGHQVVGHVVHGGKRFEEGQRVGLAWLHASCGACADCFRGDENLCRHARFTGYHADGGYAELVKIPEAFAYALPADVSDEQAAPLRTSGCTGSVRPPTSHCRWRTTWGVASTW